MINPKGKELRRNYLFTYTGKISFPDYAPCIQDIAVGLSRECRYAGAGLRWWPVALHCFCVADLLPRPLKIHGLLHDASECITGDLPKPIKTDAIEEFEERILTSIYANLKLKPPTKQQWKQIKVADKLVLRGEIYTVGTAALQAEYDRAPKAEALVVKYFKMFPPLECIHPDGAAPIEFMRRFRQYKDMI